MTWSKEAWKRIEPLYEKILAMPFNQELMKGSLDLQKFRFYMGQDAIYLGEFGKALSLISGRLKDLDQVLAFSQFASGAIVVERALHEGYFKEFGVADEAKASPTCLLYTRYLLSEASNSSPEVAAAAVLPCFWIYKAVGDYIYVHQEHDQKEGQNPYHRWIETYSGEEFAKSVHEAIAICDALAAQASPSRKEEMTEAFVRATKLEYMFWDSAYRREGWPV